MPREPQRGGRLRGSGESRAGKTDGPAMRVSAGGSAERSGEEVENLSPEEPQLWEGPQDQKGAWRWEHRTWRSAREARRKRDQGHPEEAER